MKKRDLEFLYELGALRFQPRQWKRFLHGDLANITEHHFRVIWLSLIIAAHEKVSNTDKIMKLALVHDIAESRTGDVDYLSRQYVKRDEKQGIEDMLHDTIIKDEFLQLWQEYEDRDTLEAKIVKDADNLDVDLELREQTSRGMDLEKIFKETRNKVAANRFYTKTARSMYADIIRSNPHDWHVQSPRNRLHGGDWKK